MSVGAAVAVIIVIVWAISASAVLWVDHRARRRHRDLIDARAWAEKVAAMRRIHDQDGAA